MAKKKELSFVEKMRMMARAGLEGSPSPNRVSNDYDPMDPIEERVRRMLGIINGEKRRATNMTFFVMYDISSNKVRNQVVKYLIQKGCTRVQRSIFLADLDTKVYNEIREDLAAVQQAYENEDSILIVPLSTDYLKSMKIIGQNIDIDVITKCKHTLFF
jgi:CRISPR-associated protein Cas2